MQCKQEDFLGTPTSKNPLSSEPRTPCRSTALRRITGKLVVILSPVLPTTRAWFAPPHVLLSRSHLCAQSRRPRRMKRPCLTSPPLPLRLFRARHCVFSSNKVDLSPEQTTRQVRGRRQIVSTAARRSSSSVFRLQSSSGMVLEAPSASFNVPGSIKGVRDSD